MTQPKERGKRPEIKTREPQKRTEGIFNNLRQPHPIEEILGLQLDTGTTGAATPVETPVITPTMLPASTGEPSPAPTPVISLASAPVFTPAPTGVNELQQVSPIKPEVDPGPATRSYVSLDATHSFSEQLVYSIMYRETLAKKVAERHFGTSELMKATGIRSDKTVRVAIDGLITKLSVVMVSYQVGNRLGPRYRVRPPKEIFDLRQKYGIEIDPQSKKILLPPVDTPVITPVSTTAFTPAFTPGGTPVTTTPATGAITGPGRVVTTPALTGLNAYPSTPVNSTGPLNHENTYGADAGVNPSSAAVDDEKLRRIRDLFNQLSNGGTWKEERDAKGFEKIADIPLWHVIMGLCYSVGRSPEHKMSSLAYAVPSIVQHYEQMRVFPESDMLEIAYRTMRKTLLCMQTGNWTIEDWESGR